MLAGGKRTNSLHSTDLDFALETFVSCCRLYYGKKILDNFKWFQQVLQISKLDAISGLLNL